MVDFYFQKLISMANSVVLECTEESELVLPHLDVDDKDTLTFSTSSSQKLLVDVSEVRCSRSALHRWHETLHWSYGLTEVTTDTTDRN